MLSEDSPLSAKRGDRLRRRSIRNTAIPGFKCFPTLGGVFICPENRGQAVTQGGKIF